MKKLILWLSVGFTSILLLVGVASHAAKADHVVITVDPVTTAGANPDRRRVAGAALIMESDGTINEPSIPFNAIKPTSASVPQNTIVNGELEGMDAPIKQELIVQ
jgi:hypothetical protein